MNTTLTEIMPKNRLEIFSDGVIAIIITVMVLEIKVPHGTELSDLKPLLPVFLSYALSFLYIAIYWGNHHHLVHAAKHINSAIMWANLHLLFWLSLIPFASSWFGENHTQPLPTAMYGVVLLMSAIAYFTLQRAIVRAHPNQKALNEAFAVDWKGRISAIGYASGVGLAYVNVWLSIFIYIGLAMLWLMPDRRAARAAE